MVEQKMRRSCKLAALMKAKGVFIQLNSKELIIRYLLTVLHLLHQRHHMLHLHRSLGLVEISVRAWYYTSFLSGDF